MTSQRSRFGRSKLGGGQTLLVTMSTIAGLGLSVGFGLLVANIALTHNKPLTAAIFTVCLAPGWTALMWALLVDRNTLAGAIENPKDSVESRWYSQAAEDTLHASLLALGILGVVSVFVDYSVNIGSAVATVAAFYAAVFGSAYFVRKRTES